MADYKFSEITQRDVFGGVIVSCDWKVTRQVMTSSSAIRTYYKINSIKLFDPSYQETNFRFSSLSIRLKPLDSRNLAMTDGSSTLIYTSNDAEVGFDLSNGEVTLVQNKEFYTDDTLIVSSSGKILSPSATMTFYASRVILTGGSQSTQFNGRALDILPSAFAIKPEVISAPDFNDEENPTITYPAIIPEGVTVAACISFTGGTDDVPYRSIPLTGGTYTFNLTSAERKALRQGITTGNVKALRFYIKSTFNDTTNWHYLTKNLTLINHTPTLTPTVKDIKEEIIALTGNADTVVRYESMIEFGTGAAGRKEASIVSQSVQCGSKTVSNLPNGVIDDIESGAFVFKTTDSRGFSAEKTIQKNIVNYIKPTCYQELEAELSGETSAKINLKIHGNYFNGSFGAVNNTLKLEVRHTQNDGTMGNWVTLTDGLIPTFNGNTYTLETTISGFNYSQAYEFQCRATDKLNVVISSPYTIKLLPVFDWGEYDFNFNVPVKMNGETVLRHNKEAKNTVLSASGGHVYIRPDGTDSTAGEMKISPQGNVTFGGTVEVNDSATFSGTATFASDINLNGTVKVNGTLLEDLFPEQPEVITPADYVVETGTEAMGTNGTWYWTKWASGKAECYGRRNFGKAALDKSVTNGYKTADYTQALPSGLFNAAPDVITMTPYPNDTSSYNNCFISPAGGTPASATSTGGFCIVRTSSATPAATDISFVVIGRWK